MNHTVSKKPKNTVEILLTLPWATIAEEYDKSFNTLVKDLTVEGFRKGKAPKAVAEKHMSKDKVYDHMIRHYLPAAYETIIKKEDLKPIYSPKIELAKAKENEDWEIKFIVALLPEVDVKGYEKIVKKAKEEAQKPKIATSSTEAPEPEPTEQQQKEKGLQEALNALVAQITVEISDVVLDDEVESRMTRLAEDLNRLGINIETYVKSRNTTEDGMREQFRKEIEETYKLEYILQAIGEQEKIQVEKDDIDKMIGSLQNEQEKQAFMQNIYYYASMLRKQKILEHLVTI